MGLYQRWYFLKSLHKFCFNCVWNQNSPFSID